MLTPLSFVLIVSMVKDIIEDVKRHKFDKQENTKEVNMAVTANPKKYLRTTSKISSTFSGSKRDFLFKRVFWKDVKVGRIVKVL